MFLEDLTQVLDMCVCVCTCVTHTHTHTRAHYGGVRRVTGD